MMAGNDLPWLPKTPSTPTTSVCDRTPYSTILKRRRTPATTRTPTSEVSPERKPQFRYDVNDTQAWPSLSSATTEGKGGKEESREKVSNRMSHATVVAPSMTQTPRTFDNSESPILPADLHPASVIMSPPSSFNALTESQAMTSTSTGKKKRRKSSKAKATAKLQVNDESINSRSRQPAAPTVNFPHQLPVYSVSDHVKSRPKDQLAPLTPSRPVKPQLSAMPDSARRQPVKSRPKDQLAPLTPSRPVKPQLSAMPDSAGRQPVKSRPKDQLAPLTPSCPVKPQLSAMPDSAGHQPGIVSTPQENPIILLQPPSPQKHTPGVLSSTPALFDPSEYHPQNPLSSFISEQQIKKFQLSVAPPPGMDNTNNEVVKYRTKYIGLLRDEESEHKRKLYRIT